MADVTNDRAQLILVGGLVVAFALVALILLLNAALFAENVATRGLGPGPDRAGDHAAFADRAGDRVLRHEERIEYETWETARDNVTNNVERIDAAVRSRQFQQHSALASVTVDELRRGAALIQNDTQEFTSTDGERNWTLVESTGGVRNYTMAVNASGTDAASPSDAFTIRIENDTNAVWEAAVYDSGSNTIIVNVDGNTCESTGPVATINWTEGTLGDCSLAFATDSGTALQAPYNLTYLNGDRAVGTYHLVVRNNSTNDDIETGNFGDANTTTNPRQYAAVYSAVLQISYEESTTDYDTRLRAAPGEPEQTRPTS